MTAEDKRVRVALWVIMAAPALALSYLMASEFLRIGSLTNAQLLAHFEGQAYEDIFGFGFWFTWCVLAVFETAFLIVAWLLVRAKPFRIGALVLLALFALSSILFYIEDARELSLYMARGKA